MKPAFFLRAALIAAPALLRADAVLQFSLVGDMYPDGRKIERPSPGHPVFYYAYVDGYHQLGQQIKGEAPPPTHEIVHHLAQALASQGYFVTHEISAPGGSGSPNSSAKAFSPPPSILLVFTWGSLNSISDQPTQDADDPDSDPLTGGRVLSIYNGDKILGLTAGKNFDSVAVPGNDATESVLEEENDDHIFAMISAYDFNAYFHDHKRVRLWVAKMSVPAKGNSMAEVIPKLVDAGAPLFGRETMGPKHVEVSTVPDGKVEVGTPTVKGYQTPANPSP